MTADFFDGLGRALAELRHRKRLPQNEVAQRAGVTRSQLSAYENQRARPSLTTLGRILRAEGCTLGDLDLALRIASGSSQPCKNLLEDREILELCWRLLGAVQAREAARGECGSEPAGGRRQP
jgi:transcriptional regulator with XRE-family HTH domain